MANWKDPALLLGLANTGGIAATFIYLLKYIQDLQRQITELNAKHDILYKEIGGGNGQLYKFITQKVINEVPTMQKETTIKFTRAAKQLKKLREEHEEMLIFINNLMVLLIKILLTNWRAIN